MPAILLLNTILKNDLKYGIFKQIKEIDGGEGSWLNISRKLETGLLDSSFLQLM